MEVSRARGSQSTMEDSSSDMRAPRWVGKRVGRFRLISLLGKGGFGRVFLAEDVDLDRRVALKIITADAAAKSLREEARADGDSMETTSLDAAVTEAVERMIREARAAARLEHPGVVQIFEIGRLEAKGLGGYIAMEHLEGGTLQEMLRASGPLDVQRACALIADAAEALQYGHDLGVIHRDIKPANLMLSRSGRCKVADFGLACIDDLKSGKRSLARGGTASYMAPEVIRGGMPDALSDQYALAATIYTLLAGHPPFQGETKKEILAAHLTSRVPDLREIRSDVDEGLWMTIRRSLSKHQEKRFPTIRQFGQALRLYTVTAHQQSEASDIFAASLAQVLAPPPTRRATGQEAAVAPAAWPQGGVTAKLARAWRTRPAWLRRITSRWLSVGVGSAILLLLLVLLWSLGVFSASPSNEASRSQAAPTPTRAEPRAAASQPDRPATAVQTSAANQVVRSGDTGAKVNPARPADPVLSQNSTSNDRLLASTGEAAAPDQPRAQQTPGSRPATRSAGSIAATDYERLLLVAEGKDPEYADRRATVAGKVIHARASDTGKVFRIYFEGTDRNRRFGVVYFPRDRLFERMQEKFGGTAGSGLEGKTIRITGTISIYQDNPQIIVESPDQIEIADAAAE